MDAHRHDVAAEVGKVLPSASVGTLTLFGVPLPAIVMVVTLVYTVLNLYVLVRDKLYTPWKEKKSNVCKQ